MTGSYEVTFARPGDRDVLAPELPPHLPGAVGFEVLVVDLAQPQLQRFIAHPPRRRLPAAGGVVRRPGDLQLAADRLDPEALAVGVDDAGHFGSRGSSSRAKKAEAAWRISLARRSSRFSRLSSRSRSRSSVVSPGRAPPSTSARRTQMRSVSGVIPNFEAIEVIAAHCEVCSASCSSTMRTARSRISAGYLPGRVIAPSSQRVEPPTFPGRFSVGAEPQQAVGGSEIASFRRPHPARLRPRSPPRRLRSRRASRSGCRRCSRGPSG